MIIKIINKIVICISLLASSKDIYEVSVKLFPTIKKIVEKYFPTTEQIKRCLFEYDRESNSLNKKFNYRSDYIKLYKTILTKEPYNLYFNSNEYGELTKYLFDGSKEGQSESFYGLELLNKGDYLEITTNTECFKKKLCRKASIKYLNKILKR